MGQKVRPIGFRLSVRRDWRSVWFSDKREFGNFLFEDFQLRKKLMSKSCCQGCSRITIRRMSEKIEIVIHTSRPGLVIGKKGSEIDSLKEELSKFTGKEIWVEVDEIKQPDREAKLVSENIARQLERRGSFRRAMKKAIQQTMDAGAAGIRVQVSGRLGGAEIARTEWYLEGSVPLHTLRADIDYAEARAETTYGTIGVKVWINRGEQQTRPSKGA